MFHVGFTGTRRAVTGHQRDRLDHLLHALAVLVPDTIVHHGCCVGADAVCHELCRKHGIRVAFHPPLEGRYAFAPDPRRGDVVAPPLPYLDRNQAIIDTSTLLIACPAEHQERLRSGTWATVRRARAKGIKIVFLYPQGTQP